MLKKILSKVLIGSAKADLLVSKDKAIVGETFEVELEIKGGKVEQKIDTIKINLFVRSKKGKGDDKESTVDSFTLVDTNEEFTLSPGEEIKHSFSITIPYDIPISRKKTKLYLQTILDIKKAMDPGDWDELTIQPHAPMQMFFKAVTNLGFSETHASGFYDKPIFSNEKRYQEFEFKPVFNSPYAGKLDEIEIYTLSGEHGLQGKAQIDKKAKGITGIISDALDMDEAYIDFSMPFSEYESIDTMEAFIKDMIEKGLEQTL